MALADVGRPEKLIAKVLDKPGRNLANKEPALAYDATAASNYMEHAAMQPLG